MNTNNRHRVPPPLPPPRFVDEDHINFGWDQKRLQETVGQDHAITPHSLPTGRTPSNIKISNSRATKEKVATWPGELSLARPTTTRNHSDSTIKAPVPQEQTISLPVSATTSSTSSLPSFASLMADDPTNGQAASETRSNGSYDQSLISRLSQRSDPLIRGAGVPQMNGTPASMSGHGDPGTPKSFEGLHGPHHTAVPRYAEHPYMMQSTTGVIISPPPSGPSSVLGQPMYPAMVPSQYTLDNRYFPYSVPRTADNMQVGSIDYRDVVQENAGLQQVHPREGTPDNRLDGAKTGQKRRANSPPPSSSIPQGSAGVPFSRRPPIGFNGPQIMYQASPIHPQLEGSGYSTGAYPSPASWSIGASVANSSMQSYALPDAASLNSSPYAGLRSGTPIANLPRGSSQPHPIIQQLGRGGESTLGSAANILPLPITPVPPYGASTTLRLGGAYVCECCPKKPKKYESLDQLRAHEIEKQYACLYCNNRFKNKNEAERHQNSLHLRPHSWSCGALQGVPAAFHATSPALNRPFEPPSNSIANITAGASPINGTEPSQNPTISVPSMRSDASAGSTTKGLSNLHVSDTDSCGYCGLEFVNDPEPDWAQRVEHLTQVHKFNECTQNKKFFRADHFRQHLKHSHAGTSGKWTNMLEAACMRDEQPPVPIARDAVVTLAAMGPEAGMVVTDSSGTLPVLSPIKPVPLQPQLSQIPQLPQLPQLSQIPQQPLPTRIPLPASQPPSPPQQQQPQQEQEQPQKLQPLAPMQARVEITPEPDPGDQLREQRQQQRQQNQQQQQQQDATAVAVH